MSFNISIKYRRIRNFHWKWDKWNFHEIIEERIEFHNIAAFSIYLFTMLCNKNKKAIFRQTTLSTAFFGWPTKVDCHFKQHWPWIVDKKINSIFSEYDIACDSLILLSFFHFFAAVEIVSERVSETHAQHESSISDKLHRESSELQCGKQNLKWKKCLSRKKHI